MPEQQESRRERIIRLIREARNHTVARGCTPPEAAAFAAKVAEWIEKYQIDEAELDATRADGACPVDTEVEVCENLIRTGAKVFNPGRTAVVNSLAQAMSCKCVLLHQGNEAVYGIVGEVLDANYVCQISMTLVPQLYTMAKLEGAEHGYEKAGLVRWANQYLTGAGVEIYNRITKERKERSDRKQLTTGGIGTALAVITGDSLAVVKARATLEVFGKLYPNTRTTRSRSEFISDAYARGKEAGKRVGLNVSIE